MTQRNDISDDRTQPDFDRLETSRRQLSDLKSQMQYVPGELREEISEQLSKLEVLGDETANRFDELGDAGHHAIAELRAGIELATEDLESGLRTLQHKLDSSDNSGSARQSSS